MGIFRKAKYTEQEVESNISKSEFSDAPLCPKMGKSSKADFLYDYDEDVLRDIARTRVDSLEQWCRRLVDYVLKMKIGVDYSEHLETNGVVTIKNSIITSVRQRRERDPLRFPRWVDATFIEGLSYLICRDGLYTLYSDTFNGFYYSNKELASVFERIRSIRNKLSHGNAISIHEFEQALCYADDIT